MKPPPDKPLQPVRALRALRRLLQDPNDTSLVAEVVEALEGDSQGRLYRRLVRHPDGRRLLEHPPDLLRALGDRQTLAAMASGSLGQGYLRWSEQEGRDSEGLREVVEQGRLRARRDLGETHFVGAWMRDTHDLYHQVTGYGTDLLGELCVLTFSAVQTRNTGVLVPVITGALHLRRQRADVPALVWGALMRAREARFFAAQDWLALLPLQLAEVRARLRVRPAPEYTPLRAEDALAVVAAARGQRAA